MFVFFFQAEDGIRDSSVTGVQTCALPICLSNEWKKARWKDGQLILPRLAPLPLPAVAAKAHARNGVTGAMAHGFNRWAWSQATFVVSEQPWTADIDALAVRRGAGKFVRIDRSNVKFPLPTSTEADPPLRPRAPPSSPSRPISHP